MNADDLGAKVKALPPVVWAVAAGGVLGLVLLRRRGAAAAAAPATTTAGGTAATAGDLGATIGGSASGGVGDVGDVGTPTTVDPPSNDSWRLLALPKVIAQGYNAYLADSALSKFLSGESLRADEQAVVARALTLAGPTPTATPVPLPSADAGPAPTYDRYGLDQLQAARDQATWIAAGHPEGFDAATIAQAAQFGTGATWTEDQFRLFYNDWARPRGQALL